VEWFVRESAADGRTALAGVLQRASGGRVSGCIQVGVREDDGRRVPAKFHVEFDDAALLGDALAGARRPGYRDGVDPFVTGQGVTDDAPVIGDVVERAVREPDVGEDVGQDGRADGRVRRGLADGAAAGGEGRRDLQRGSRER